MKVSIIGVTGYSWLELLRYLRRHPLVEIVSIHSRSMNKKSIDQIGPHLKKLVNLPIEEINIPKIMENSELVFFATPSGISKELALPFVKENFPVIDLSGDFRLKKEGMYEKWYGKMAAPQKIISSFDYGLSEFRENSNARFIANPGCYATATELSLAPLVKGNKIDFSSIVVDAKSGLSGAGKSLTETTHFTFAHDNMHVYKMNSHQHIPEIIQQLQKWQEAITAIQFTTSLIPITRGIFVTTYAKMNQPQTTKQLIELYKYFYAETPFIRIQEVNDFPTIKQVVGSNYCDIGIAYNEITNMVTIVAVIDNLGKGAAGQAVQNLNILAGYPETTGLDLLPVYP